MLFYCWACLLFLFHCKLLATNEMLSCRTHTHTQNVKIKAKASKNRFNPKKIGPTRKKTHTHEANDRTTNKPIIVIRIELNHNLRSKKALDFFCLFAQSSFHFPFFSIFVQKMITGQKKICYCFAYGFGISIETSEMFINRLMQTDEIKFYDLTPSICTTFWTSNMHRFSSIMETT